VVELSGEARAALEKPDPPEGDGRDRSRLSARHLVRRLSQSLAQGIAILAPSPCRAGSAREVVITVASVPALMSLRQ
jgi:hypothetical protein